MKVLVIGSGGREHAIVHALAQNSQVKQLWCAPGNPGIAQEAECVHIQADNIRDLFAFARDNHVDLTFVGPEAPLVDGIVDHFRQGGLTIVGPTKTAARLEGSKSFAKTFMHKYGIPTARYEVVPNLQKGSYLLSHWKGPCVVKADGLAAGKGVKVCRDAAEAKEFLFEVMEKEMFGAAGSTVVLEECLHGEEATVMAFCDGKSLVPMPASQDHKRLLDNDEGPNTGGMGAYAPAPVLTPELMKRVETEIFQPFLKGIAAEGFDFRGIIYFGLMLTSGGPQVLEFNVRFGDPETQVVLPLLESDLAEILLAVAEKRLADVPGALEKEISRCAWFWRRPAIPLPMKRGKSFKVWPTQTGGRVESLSCRNADRKRPDIVTAGGRVLGVTALGDTLEAARDKAYDAARGISFEGMIFRKDIGAKALTVSGRADEPDDSHDPRPDASFSMRRRSSKR